MLRRFLPASLLLCLLLVLSGTLHAATPASTPAGTPVDPQFTDSLVVKIPADPAYSSPTDFDFTPDGRMLVVTKLGKLHIYQNTNLVLSPTLDFVANLCTESERGLLGITVDPNFAANQFIYFYYTYDRGQRDTSNGKNSCFNNDSTRSPVNRVVRYTLSSTNVVASNKLLIDNIPSPNGNHNAGSLNFGKDGYLYVSVGDGGCDYDDKSTCGGDNKASRDDFILLGKVLRITRDGDIPADNPFQGTNTARCNVNGRTSADKRCQETFAHGLRNPFRLAFDPNAAGTRFYINDVGQNIWEEIDEGIKGADYGWNVREGHCKTESRTDCGAPPTGMTNPVYDYDHQLSINGKNCTSITGGAFVPNGVWSAAYDGAYIFSDYQCGVVFTLKPNGSGGYTRANFMVADEGGSLVTLKFGPYNGTQALYYTNFANGGQIRRITYTGTGNRAPTAKIVATPTSGDAPLAVQFDGTQSSDPDGDALSYLWDFGDGQTSTLAKPPHTFTSGTYTVKLVVRDSRGASSDPVTARIDAGNTPPVPLIESPAANLRFTVGQAITLHGSATDAQDGALGGAQLSWAVLLHHDQHTHPYRDLPGGATFEFPAPAPEDLLAATNSYLEIRLIATDSKGLSSVVAQNIYPTKVNVTLNSEPAGATIIVNGVAITTPHTLVSWEGYQMSVVAPDQPNGSGGSLRFDHWADGGASTRTIITAATPVTYTAVFSTSTTPIDPLPVDPLPVEPLPVEPLPACAQCAVHLPLLFHFAAPATATEVTRKGTPFEPAR